MSSRTITRTLLVAALLSLAAAHFNFYKPMPYNPIDCNKPDCQGPCPPIWKTGRAKARNSPSNPSATWQRGQNVQIEWNRNNHEGGYYRRSLVPVKYMNSFDWHKKTAFEWGCWNQNRYFCGFKKECGTDKKGMGYRNTMTVPKTFPDGDYVFAMLWYGGLHWRRNKAHFSDYHSCAFVRIKGGELVSKHTPTFVRGTNHRKVKAGTCASTSSFIGECGGGPCDKNKVTEDVPGVFRNGKPQDVLLSNLDKNAMATVPDSALPVAPISDEKKMMEESKKEEMMDEKFVNEEQNSSSSPSGGGSTSSKPSAVEPSKSDKCAQASMGPQKPTGSWGKKGSKVYNSKLKQYRAWRKYCKPRKICSC